METQFTTAIIQKLMSALKKAMKQRQKARVRATQMKKAPKKIERNLLDKHKLDDYDTDE